MPNVAAIPETLRNRAQWVCWRYEHREGESKPTKVPINPKTGHYASTTTPETWSSLKAAMRRLEAGGVDGLGYVFQDDHIGIDLDNAIDPTTSTIKPWAQEILKDIPSYAERSPSGIGIHIITPGALPKEARGLKRPYQDGAVEIYSKSRYFTMTGASLNGSSLRDYSPAAMDLHRRLAGPVRTDSGNKVVKTFSDDLSEPSHRLEVALRDPVFSKLWRGDTSTYGDDESRADLALCNKLVFYFGPDHQVVDSMFRQSRLMREKWEREDYRKSTINKAIEGTSETYTPPKNGHGNGQGQSRIEPISHPREENSESDDDAAVIPNLSTAVRILERDFKGRIWFDEFLNKIMTGDPPREWSDADDIRLTVEIQRKKHIPKMAFETVAKAVIAVASSHKKHCVRDRLVSLEWDQIHRIEHFFEDHFGAEGDEYTRAASRNFWISMIARIMDPGCKADHVIVLEGSQGTRKSMALAAIGGPYYTEQHESVSGKGFFEVLQGKFLVEIAELDAFSRAEVTRVKQVITSLSDRYRPAYGRHAKDHPRQCVFVGTTNADDWNRDSTGARRFWPVACHGEIDVAAITANRDQFFAEALARYRAGESWWEMPTEETTREQSQRYDSDAWTDDIAEFIHTQPKITVREILTNCLKIDLGKITKIDQMRVANCLRVLGWKRGKNERVESKQVRFWKPQTQK